MVPRAMPPPALAGGSDKPVLEVSIGRQIRLRRMLTGLTQAQLATLLGVTYQHVHQFERGHHLNASRLYAISRALAVPIEMFFLNVDASLGSSLLDSGMASDATNLPLENGLMGDGRQQPEILTMVKAFQKIKSQDDRKRLLMWINDLSRNPNVPFLNSED